MPDARIVAWIRDKFQALQAELDERGRRRWAASEARSLGWSGIAVVAVATGLSDRTIRSGIRELAEQNPLSEDRQRRRAARFRATDWASPCHSKRSRAWC